MHVLFCYIIFTMTSVIRSQGYKNLVQAECLIKYYTDINECLACRLCRLQSYNLCTVYNSVVCMMSMSIADIVIRICVTVESLSYNFVM